MGRSSIVVYPRSRLRLLATFGFSPLGVIGLLVLAILPLFPPFDQQYLIRWLIMGCIMGEAAMAFDFSGGYIAVINFGFMAFFGLGAHTSGLVTIFFNWSPWLAMIVGAVSSAALGFLTGAVSLRLAGTSL